MYNASESSSRKRKGKCGIKRERSSRVDKILIRNNKMNPTKRSSVLQRVLLTSGFDIVIQVYAVGFSKLAGQQEHQRKRNI